MSDSKPVHCLNCGVELDWCKCCRKVGHVSNDGTGTPYHQCPGRPAGILATAPEGTFGFCTGCGEGGRICPRCYLCPKCCPGMEVHGESRVGAPAAPPAPKSMSEYRRMKAQGADVEPPKPPDCGCLGVCRGHASREERRQGERRKGRERLYRLKSGDEVFEIGKTYNRRKADRRGAAPAADVNKSRNSRGADVQPPRPEHRVEQRRKGRERIAMGAYYFTAQTYVLAGDDRRKADRRGAAPAGTEYDHLHEENAYGVCRICAQRKAMKSVPAQPPAPGVGGAREALEKAFVGYEPLLRELKNLPATYRLVTGAIAAYSAEKDREWMAAFSRAYGTDKDSTWTPADMEEIVRDLTRGVAQLAEKDRVIAELRNTVKWRDQYLAEVRTARDEALGRVEELERALHDNLRRHIGHLARIEQALRSQPEVPPLADMVCKWREAAMALMGKEGGDGSRQE